MKKQINIIIAFFSSVSLIAQSDYKMKGNEKYVEIDFLSSYYSQDGNNAAVTGGVGTEALTDLSNIFVVNIPIDSTRSINGSFGADYYTSASTDMIDNNRSSASSKDVRGYGSIGYQKKNLNNGLTYGARLGFSAEYDYTSFNGGLNLAKEFNNGNSEIALSGQAFVDSWIPYFPRELRREVSVPTTSRNSFNGQLTWSQILNRRMQVALSAEVIYMKGLLSTPFHRVYFADQSRHDIERLPGSRIKFPFSVRMNYYPLDNLVLRSYYRYYTDDFGINAHTVSIETPVKLNDEWTLSPFYRFHTQTAADYFAPFETHLSSQEFYSSDYDLSALATQKFGMGIGYAPLYGLARAKVPFTKRIFMLKEINLRGAYYQRDTGLTGYNVSLEVKMRF